MNKDLSAPHALRLREVGWALVQTGWLALALLMVGVLLTLSWYFLNRTFGWECPDPSCAKAATFPWAGGQYWPLRIYGLLEALAILLNGLVFITVALWVFFSRPRWIWGYVFSAAFLLGWYGEINIIPLRYTFPNALNFGLSSLGLETWANDPHVLQAADTLRRVLKMTSDLLMVLLVFTFPNGKVYPRWMLGFYPLLTLLLLGVNLPQFKGTVFNFMTWPYGLPLLIQIAIVFTLVTATLMRHRSLDDRTRRQVQIILPVIVVNLLSYLVFYTYEAIFFASTPGLAALQLSIRWINALLMVWFVIAAGQVILEQKRFDTSFVLNRALVFAALTLTTGLVYVAVVGGLGALLQSRESGWLAVIATALVAVIFHPLQSRFRNLVNRLFYGEPEDPYRALAQLGRRLERSLPHEDVLPSIVQTVATTLQLPYVAIELPGGTVTAHGQPTGDLVRIPLVNYGKGVGQLLVASREPSEAFIPSEMRLLEDLARQIAVAVQEVRLTREVQQSREAIVLAREEERKRIRRDLHDGLGPTLASLSSGLEAARNLMERNPQKADQLMVGSIEKTQEAIADIRRLVYGLRPPALDELGLREAIAQQATQIPDIELEWAIGPLPALPAAVEVAAYRIVSEALNNVRKHAQATQVRIMLGYQNQTLWIEVADNGQGAQTPAAGVGMQSMRERAEELGGSFGFETTATGSKVRAAIPLKPNEPKEPT